MLEIGQQGELNKKTSGMLQVALAYVLWGVLPIYWKALQTLSAGQILAHRILWSFLFVLVLLALTRSVGKFKSMLNSRRELVIIAFCAVFISINWFTYIWAVNSGHIVESSMGYYINPLMSILLGMAILKEKMDFYQYLALFLAAIGVGIITVQHGRIPWVALALAVSFALYGLLKKLVKAEAIVGMALETAILAPVALGYILFLQAKGQGALGIVSMHMVILLLCAGFVTATPLLLFAAGAKKVELSTMGFLQYFSPTISLILGIFAYGEKFSAAHFASFGLIWTGLLIYTLSRLGVFRGIEPVFRKMFGASAE